MQADGADLSRSARGRLAIEAIMNPASLLPQRGVVWEAIDEESVRATLPIDGESFTLTLTVKPDGRLHSVVMERWGNLTEDGHYAHIPFGVEVLEERTFGGYTIPVRVHVGWWYGTDHYFDFFHSMIQRAEFR